MTDANAAVMVLKPDLDAMVEALRKAREFIDEYRGEVRESYTIQSLDSPDRGKLDDDGKVEIVPFDEIITEIDAVLAKVVAS